MVRVSRVEPRFWFKSFLRNFFRLLCSVYLPQKVRGIFTLKTQKTGLGLAMIAIPKPVFAYFTVFRAISGPKKENCLICPVDKSGNPFVKSRKF